MENVFFVPLLRLDYEQDDFRRHAKADRDDAVADACGYEEMMIVFKEVSASIAVS